MCPIHYQLINNVCKMENLGTEFLITLNLDKWYKNNKMQLGRVETVRCFDVPFCEWVAGDPGDCFTNVSQALQNNLAKIYNASNHIYGENFKLKLCTCAQSMALGTRTKLQFEMLIGSAISATHKFRENILESSQNVSETTPWYLRVSRSKDEHGTVGQHRLRSTECLPFSFVTTPTAVWNKKGTI